MKHLIQAFKDETIALITLVVIFIFIGSITWFLHIWFGEYAVAIALLLVLVVIQGVIVCERAHHLRQLDEVNRVRSILKKSR